MVEAQFVQYGSSTWPTIIKTAVENVQFVSALWSGVHQVMYSGAVEFMNV